MHIHLQRQLSIALENQPGRLAAISRLLADHGINIEAISVIDNVEQGMVRLMTERRRGGARARSRKQDCTSSKPRSRDRDHATGSASSPRSARRSRPRGSTSNTPTPASITPARGRGSSSRRRARTRRWKCSTASARELNGAGPPRHGRHRPGGRARRCVLLSPHAPAPRSGRARRSSSSAPARRAAPRCASAARLRIGTAKRCVRWRIPRSSRRICSSCAAAGFLPEVLLVCTQPDQLLGVHRPRRAARSSTARNRARSTTQARQLPALRPVQQRHLLSARAPVLHREARGSPRCSAGCPIFGPISCRASSAGSCAA